MKISFVISKIENQFFFTSNLSQWHFSCRPDYNAAWFAHMKSSPMDDKILDDVKKVLSQHGYGYKNGKNLYIGQFLYIPRENQKLKNVKSNLSSQEYKLLERGIAHFNNRFQKIWNPVLLRTWQNAFKKELKKPNIKKLFLMVESFYGVSFPENLRVHLIASPSVTRSVAGSANIGSRDIVLEVPIFDLKPWNVEFGVAILIHELIHTLIDGSSKIQTLITKELKNSQISKSNKNKIFNRTKSEFIRELLGELCAPFGYPCHKTFTSFEPIPDILIPNLTHKNDSFNVFMKRIVWSMYPDVGLYIEEKRKIDVCLIERALILSNIFYKKQVDTY